jgi:peptidoglycan/xylan/chitin deacetylase (PgdA/CDA1 family)
MLHSVTNDIEGGEGWYNISPRRLRRMLDLLKMQGLGSESADAMSNRTGCGRLMVTVDDGYETFYSTLYPMLRDRGLQATVFLVADRIGGVSDWRPQMRPLRLLSGRQVRELHAQGVSFGSHSLTHRWLPGLPTAEVRSEVRDSKAQLEDLLGTPIKAFSYPWGGVDERVRAEVAEAGYEIAFGTEQGLNFWEDPLRCKRIAVGERLGFFEFVMLVRSGRTLPQQLRGWVRRIVSHLPDGMAEQVFRAFRVPARRADQTLLSADPPEFLLDTRPHELS